jgi:hypothetical protein
MILARIGDKMVKHRKFSKKSINTTPTLSTVLIPLMIILTVGITISSLTVEPIARALSVTVSSSGAAPKLPIDVPNSTTILAQEIPNDSFASSTINGITFYAGNFRLVTPPFDNITDTWLAADLCYDLIDNGDWIIDHTDLMDIEGRRASWVETDAIEIRLPPELINGEYKQKIIIHNGQATGNNDYSDVAPDQTTGQRCDTVSYSLPADFDISQFTIFVDSIISSPSEGDECSGEVRKKLQEVLDQRGTGIKTKSKVEQGDYGGTCGIEIVQKPNGMSDEEAHSIVYSHEIYLDLFGIRGPWMFKGSVK